MSDCPSKYCFVNSVLCEMTALDDSFPTEGNVHTYVFKYSYVHWFLISVCRVSEHAEYAK